jgi:hypothetical protein
MEDSAGELRRAYEGGRLIKAERGRLIALTRHRTSSAVQMLRQELSAEEQLAFCETCQRHLNTLAAHLVAGELQIVRQVPASAAFPDCLAAWLRRIGAPLRIAAAPHSC